MGRLICFGIAGGVVALAIVVALVSTPAAIILGFIAFVFAAIGFALPRARGSTLNADYETLMKQPAPLQTKKSKAQSAPSQPVSVRTRTAAPEARQPERLVEPGTSLTL